MVHAFIMVQTDAGKSEALLADVTQLDGVAEAHIVAGDFDIIVEVDTEEVYEVLHTASSDIQDLDGVADTKTYISLE
jgi:DNA-binding Lrp family transcriptional regulator